MLLFGGMGWLWDFVVFFFRVSSHTHELKRREQRTNSIVQSFLSLSLLSLTRTHYSERAFFPMSLLATLEGDCCNAYRAVRSVEIICRRWCRERSLRARKTKSKRRREEGKRGKPMIRWNLFFFSCNQEAIFLLFRDSWRGGAHF